MGVSIDWCIMSPGARGSNFGLAALGLASLGIRYFKTAPFETNCPWVSEDAQRNDFGFP